MMGNRMTQITPRNRVWQAIRHQQPDRVPWQFGYTVPARRKLEEHFGTTDLDAPLGNHLLKFRPRAADALVELRPGFWRDEFGVLWNRTIDKDIGNVVEYQLKDRSLAGFTFPDPHDPRRYADWPALLAAHADRFRYASIAFSLFERAWTLRGIEPLLIDMLEAPEFVDQLLDALTAFDLGILEEVLSLDIDGVMFGDDWGQQKGLIFGHRLWRRFIKPRITQLYGAVKRAGKAVLIHSCGQVQELFPELIEAGLDVFNPFQPEAMDPYETKRRFGARLTFWGGVSVQKLLPFGTPPQIRDEVRRLIDGVGAGGGFIIGPSHDMPGDIPLENLLALVEAVHAG
jgi:uroporphyrinogen decarboxylase